MLFAITLLNCYKSRNFKYPKTTSDIIAWVLSFPIYLPTHLNTSSETVCKPTTDQISSIHCSQKKRFLLFYLLLQLTPRKPKRGGGVRASVQSFSLTQYNRQFPIYHVCYSTKWNIKQSSAIETIHRCINIGAGTKMVCVFKILPFRRQMKFTMSRQLGQKQTQSDYYHLHPRILKWQKFKLTRKYQKWRMKFEFIFANTYCTVL